MNRVDSYVETDDGTLLLTTNNGLEEISDGKIRNFVLPGVTEPFSAEYSLRSSDGSLWIGTRSGLLHVHQGRTDAFRAADGLSSDAVTGRIFEDREGKSGPGPWAGSTGSGPTQSRRLVQMRVSQVQTPGRWKRRRMEAFGLQLPGEWTDGRTVT